MVQAMTNTNPAKPTAPAADAPPTESRPLVGALPDGDPRVPFAKAVALAGAVLDGVRDDQLALPTPCDGMDVELLRRHLVMVLRRVTSAGRGLPLAEWPTEADVDDRDLRVAWDASAHELQEVWTDDSLLEQPMDLPWTTIPGAEVLGIYVNELVVHTWDLAVATGQQPVWDPEVIAVAEAAVHAELPEADRAPMWAAMASQMPPGVAWEVPFQNAVEVPADAPAIERLVAWNGRQP